MVIECHVDSPFNYEQSVNICEFQKFSDVFRVCCSMGKYCKGDTQNSSDKQRTGYI